MNVWRAGFEQEVARIRRTPVDLMLLTAMPLILLALMAAMIWPGTPTRIAVVVVDQDNSALSQAILRTADASKAVRVIARTGDVNQAMSLIRSEQAVAALVIPKGVGSRDSHGAPVQILYQAAFLSSGALASTGLKTAVTTALRDHNLANEGLAGLTALHPPLPGVQVTILGNPSTSMEWYLGLMLGPATLHLLIAITCVSSISALMRDGRFTEFVSQPRPALRLSARLAPHVVAGVFWGAGWLLWLTLARGYHAEGALWLIVAALILLFVATAAVSLLLLAATRDTATALSGAVIVAGSALAYSGASLPITGAGGFARIWSALLPLTHFLEMEMDQALGVDPWVAAKSAGALLLYPVCAGALALLLIRRDRRPLPAARAAP